MEANVLTLQPPLLPPCYLVFTLQTQHFLSIKVPYGPSYLIHATDCILNATIPHFNIKNETGNENMTYLTFCPCHFFSSVTQISVMYVLTQLSRC